MQAAIFTGPRQLLIKEVKKPQVGRYDLLVKIKAAAICGTDVDIFRGKGGAKFPVIPGHEAAGEIEEIGSNVTTFKKGDRVVIDPAISCGQCFWCKKGLRNICPNGGLIGREKDGAFAEFISVPESNVYKIPEDMNFEEATIVITLSTVLHSHRLIDIFPEDSIAIMGCGFTGLLHIQVVKLRGARPIIAISRSLWKLCLAEKLGANFVKKSGENDIISVVRELTENRGVDLAIETVGNSAALRECTEFVRTGGKILAFGISSDKLDINMFLFYYKQLSIIGSRAMLPEDFNPSIQMIATKQINVKPLITHKIPFEKLERGLDMFEDRSVKSIRIVVTR